MRPSRRRSNACKRITATRFVIKTKDADVNKKITLDVKNEEIGAVVGKMFAGQNVVSSVEGKMIAIMSAPAKRDAAAALRPMPS